jgi:DUF218 domain
VAQVSAQQRVLEEVAGHAAAEDGDAHGRQIGIVREVLSFRPVSVAPLVLRHPSRVGVLAAELVANRVRARPWARIVLSDGPAAAGMYAALRAHAADGSLPMGDATVFAPAGELLGIDVGAIRPLEDGEPVDLVVAEAEPPAIRDAREVILLASGLEDAGALRATLERSPLRDHPRLTVIADEAAASAMRPHPGQSSDRALIVLGHREPGISAEHRISDETRARLRRAERECRLDPPRTVIFTGYTRTPRGLSEAEQMKAEWTLPEIPALLEDAGRNTAENASRSLPIIRAIGDIRRVTVVTSGWHVRTPYFFAPYRMLGLDLSFAWTPHGPWPRMLAHELREAPAMRRERRRAMGEMRLPAELELTPASSPAAAASRAGARRARRR